MAGFDDPSVTEENMVLAEPELRRALGPFQLIGIGIGIIIGAGIFVSPAPRRPISPDLR
jgi:hypothetical protein